jgi:hypothetical protein
MILNVETQVGFAHSYNLKMREAHSKLGLGCTNCYQLAQVDAAPMKAERTVTSANIADLVPGT